MIYSKNYKLTDLVKYVNGKIISLKDVGLHKEELLNINTPYDYNDLNK